MKPSQRAEKLVKRIYGKETPPTHTEETDLFKKEDIPPPSGEQQAFRRKISRQYLKLRGNG